MSSGSDLPSQPPHEQLLPEHRDEAVEVLTQHFAGDRLSMDEFEQRTAAVYAAQTVADVRAALGNLPVIPAGTLEGTSILEGDCKQSAPIAGQQQLTVMLSNHERGGALVVPAKLRIRNVLGNVELDLREATFTAAITEIDISAVLGNVEITLPLGVRVESQGEAILGSFETGTYAKGHTAIDRSVVAYSDTATPRVVRLTGKSVLASVGVRNRALKEGTQKRVENATPTPLAREHREPQRLLKE